jgi:hypothetical protein
MGGVLRSRPCGICRRWFRPHPRAGDRQRVCSSEECQRERHRRACEHWHAANAEEERVERVRQRVTVGAAGAAPAERLDWGRVRDAVGVEVAVIIGESVRHVQEWARDAVRVHPCGMTGQTAGHGCGPPRDGIGAASGGA